MGGADDLRAGSGRETIDGGAGDDRIEGGWNHDVLTGGPGKDVIYGDSTSGNCGGNGQSCTIPFGNDTINARDGEADQVDCGAGNDRAVVDALDTVAANCETVDGGRLRLHRTGHEARRCHAAGREAGTAANRPAQGPPRGARRLRACRGPAARAGRPSDRRLGAHHGRCGRHSASSRARFTRAARRSLSRRRSVKLVVTAGTAAATITVKR